MLLNQNMNKSNQIEFIFNIFMFHMEIIFHMFAGFALIFFFFCNSSQFIFNIF